MLQDILKNGVTGLYEYNTVNLSLCSTPNCVSLSKYVNHRAPELFVEAEQRIAPAMPHL